MSFRPRPFSISQEPSVTSVGHNPEEAATHDAIDQTASMRLYSATPRLPAGSCRCISPVYVPSFPCLCGWST